MNAAYLAGLLRRGILNHPRNILRLPKIRRGLRCGRIRLYWGSIWELEQAGMVLARKHYSELAVDDTALMGLKADVERLLWPGYKRPICSSILTGIHIDNIGTCPPRQSVGANYTR
jgi:hypothetical protein